MAKIGGSIVIEAIRSSDAIKSFLKNTKEKPINCEIPGYKCENQLKVVAQISSSLPLFSRIVEFGSCAGRGTWTWSKNAPLGSQIFAIDWWQGIPLFVGNGFKLDKTESDTIEYFKKHVRDCSNITPIRGDAMNIPLLKKIDCLVIDCDAGRNKNDHFRIWERWRDQLNPSAIVVGANYYPELRPDEVSFADHIGSELGNLQQSWGIWWSFKGRSSKVIVESAEKILISS